MTMGGEHLCNIRGVRMRKILFRGRQLYSGEWVEGDLVHSVYKIWDTCVGKYGTDFGMHQVTPATVGQYTGLKDKNGKRIFEGDIVRHLNGNPDFSLEEIGHVYWDKEYCGWRRTSNGAFHRGVIDTYRMAADCCYEVIGNIHDNPELMD